VNLFPRQAAANRTIFYGADGQARSIRQVYQVLVAKHEGGANASFTAQQIADDGAAAQPPAEPPLPSRFSTENMSFTGLFKTVPDAELEQGAPGAAFFTQLYNQ